MRPENRELLFVCYQFPPFLSSGMSRIRNLLECLPDAGWDPVFLVPEAEAYPEAYLDPDSLRQVPPGLAVYRTPLRRPLEGLVRLRGLLPGRGAGRRGDARPPGPAPRGRGPWQRLEDLLGDALTIPDPQVGWLPFAVAGAREAFRRHHLPLVLSTGPPWTSHLVARLLRRRHRTRWVADFRDPWVGNPFQEEGETRLRSRLDRWLEARVVAEADLVVTSTSELGREMLRRHPGADPRRFHVMTNGVSPRLRAEVRSWPPPPRDPGRLTLAHAGTLYGGRRPGVLFEGLRALLAGSPAAAAEIRLELYGRAQDPEGIRSLLRGDPGLARVVTYHGAVPRARALRALHAADVLLLLQPDAPLQIPGKLFEYLAFEKPILAVVGAGATRSLLERNPVARVVDIADPRALAEELRALLREHREGRLAAGFDARAAARFDFGTLCRRLARRMEELAGR